MHVVASLGQVYIGGNSAQTGLTAYTLALEEGWQRANNILYKQRSAAKGAGNDSRQGRKRIQARFNSWAGIKAYTAKMLLREHLHEDCFSCRESSHMQA